MTENDLQVLMAEAIALSQQRDSAKAIERFQSAAQIPGASGEPFLLLAAEWASLGQVQEAEAAFAEAILRSPGLLVARFQLGLLQVASGRHGVGELTLSALLELPEDNPLRHYAQGYIALIHDHFDLANDSFVRGLALPQDNEALMGDIRKTLAAMPNRSEQARSAEQDAGETLGGEHHVLLANYSAGERRH